MTPSPKQRFPTPHLVIDNFLSDAAASHMLEEMIAAEPGFKPTSLGRANNKYVDLTARSSLHLGKNAGVNLIPLLDVIDAHLNGIFTATGVKSFPVDHVERSVVAHRDRDFFHRHIDTQPAVRASVRTISCVYYLHRKPRNFAGGELAIYSVLTNGPTAHIDPVHNRIVAFPSIFPHEVLPIASTGNFADSRFSVNCWLHRAVDRSRQLGEHL